MSSRIGSMSSLGTNMLPLTVSSPSASCTNSEPMPMSRPLRVEQRRAAPFRMRRRGEQRLVEQVFPVAGEFAAREHTRLQRMAAAAVADDEHVVGPDRRIRGRCARSAATSSLPSGSTSPRPCDRIVGERVAGHDGAGMRGEPDRFGFGDQVADRQHEAVVVDDDAVAGALGAEDRRGERVVRHFDAQSDDRDAAQRRGRMGPRRFSAAIRSETPSAFDRSRSSDRRSPATPPDCWTSYANGSFRHCETWAPSSARCST